MEILILQKDKADHYIRWAQTDNLNGLYELLQYFANNIYCKDFIVSMTIEKDKTNYYSLAALCDKQGIPLIWDRDENGKLIRRG